MQDKLAELSQKFEKEGNKFGSRMADAVRQYLEEFKEELCSNLQAEDDGDGKKVFKIANCLIDKAQRNDYILKHMYPILDPEQYYMMECEKNDEKVIQCINKELKRRGQSQDGRLQRVTAGYMFLDCRFAEFKELTEKRETYKAILKDTNDRVYQLEYFLTFSPDIVQRIRRMWELSKKYGDETPIAYAPYASRLVRIDMDLNVLPSLEGFTVRELDFCFENNALYKHILLGKELVWNVKHEKAGWGIQPVQSPIGEKVSYRYQFPQLRENQYIIPGRWLPTMFEIRALDHGNTVEILSGSLIEDGFDKITIYDIDNGGIHNTEIFTPNYNTEHLRKQARLRSIADIRYELNKYCADPNVWISDVETQNLSTYRKANRYRAEFSIYQKGRFGYKNTNTVYIRFTGNPEYLFFEDYINFVLCHLTYLYPEIGWEGVY